MTIYLFLALSHGQALDMPNFLGGIERVPNFLSPEPVTLSPVLFRLLAEDGWLLTLFGERSGVSLREQHSCSGESVPLANTRRCDGVYESDLLGCAPCGVSGWGTGGWQAWDEEGFVYEIPVVKTRDGMAFTLSVPFLSFIHSYIHQENIWIS